MGLFFFYEALLGFMCLTSLQVFSNERILFVRERANGYYSPGIYFLSKASWSVIQMHVILNVCYYRFYSTLFLYVWCHHLWWDWSRTTWLAWWKVSMNSSNSCLSLSCLIWQLLLCAWLLVSSSRTFPWQIYCVAWWSYFPCCLLVFCWTKVRLCIWDLWDQVDSSILLYRFHVTLL